MQKMFFLYFCLDCVNLILFTDLMTDKKVISETHFYHGFKNTPKLDGYEDYRVRKGKGKVLSQALISMKSHYSKNIYLCFLSTGISIYVKTHLNQNISIGDIREINDDSFQIMKINLGQFSIMGVYRSPSFASQGIQCRL